MKKIKFKEISAFIPGINQSRAEKQLGIKSINYYDQSSFDADYNNEEIFIENNVQSSLKNNLSLNKGDIVISNALQLATIVGEKNIGKVLSLNFSKVILDTNQIDKGYFLYLFNSSKCVKRQKDRELQGNGIVQRIPLKSLGEITVPILSLPEQKKIGEIFLETLQLQSKLNKYADLMEQFTNSILEEKLKE